MKPLVFQSQAKAELRKARDWYDIKQSGLGDELLSSVQSALERIERDNDIGSRYGATRFRFNRVKRFPYVIYYECLPDRVRIIAIAHQRRRPAYWRNRKTD